MRTYRVKLFAAARQLAGAEEVAVDLNEHATVRDLRAELARAHPALAGVLSAAMIAIDAQYVRDDCLLPAEAEIAVIPPVSGG